MGLKKNFFYSSILTVANYLFPLLTYPYVSRVLGVTNIGICNFVDSVVHYFVLFSALGIGSVGIREIAASRGDKQQLSKTFTSLVLFNTLVTAIALVVYIVAIYTVPQLYEYRTLMWIGALKILGNFLLIEWLFKGLEDFKYITNRTIIVKTLYVISVFVFVREAEDYDIYFLLMTLMVAVNAIFNIWYARKHVRLSFSNLGIFKYAKPICVLGLYTVLTSMYTTFNTTYLGFVSTNEEVGYYSTATKLFMIVIALYTAFTGVMMPRMSSLLAEGKREEFNRLINKSVNVLITFAVPLLIVCIIFSSDIIMLLSGPGYEGAYIPTMIIMPLLLIIGYNQINIVQIMTPLKAEKYISRNSIIGAIIGVSLNFLIVPHLSSIGSAITWVSSELFIMTSSYLCVKKLLGIPFPGRILLKNIITYTPAIAISIAMYFYIDLSSFLRLTIVSSFVFIYAVAAQMFCLKDEFVMQYAGKIISKIKK